MPAHLVFAHDEVVVSQAVGLDAALILDHEIDNHAMGSRMQNRALGARAEIGWLRVWLGLVLAWRVGARSTPGFGLHLFVLSRRIKRAEL
jgi:hypothetical protein